jgi:hypothetical protein
MEVFHIGIDSRRSIQRYRFWGCLGRWLWYKLYVTLIIIPSPELIEGIDDLVDLAGPHLIKFGIESKWSCEVTATARFKHNIAQALRDVRRVIEASA